MKKQLILLKLKQQVVTIKLKLCSISELIPHHNAVSGFPPSGSFLVSSLLIIKRGMTQFADTAILKHLSSHFISSSQISVILCKWLHVGRRWHQHTWKLQHKCQQHDNRVWGDKYTYNIINIHGKENRREHCRWFARLPFCRSCLRLMKSRNTVVYRYHGIFEKVLLSSDIS